jgi:hypothetical protein
MCARSKLTESGDVNFYNQSTSKVAQTALMESREDSNGERENVALTKPCKPRSNEVMFVVFPVSWSVRRVFLEHKSMYRKQKMTSTPQVDVEELERQLRREVLADLRPILEAQGIQFSDIGGVMSDKECRNSIASTAGVGRL